ncbi:UCH domain-containing protein [Cephalotus follicularis]|uniref:UCH domain-containing protein n=1 Tax=Cephalotus follicularis TaxID=3775 RepID=A0A1Q3BRT4_CEPFO|nr:UCH domain-containing protein [Cephalotus follicularis]
MSFVFNSSLEEVLSPEEKIKGRIDFLLSLDMTPYSSFVEGLDYDLYGFIVPAEEFPSSSHYYAFIFESSSWYKLNNEDIDLVDKQEVLKQEVYILFYKRRAINMNASPDYFDPMFEESCEDEHHIPKGMIHHF